MKLIFGSLLFVVTVSLTAGLYLVIRKPAQKQNDLDKLHSVSRKIASRVRQCGNYLFKFFGAKSEASTERPAAEPAVPTA